MLRRYLQTQHAAGGFGYYDAASGEARPGVRLPRRVAGVVSSDQNTPCRSMEPVHTARRFRISGMLLCG